MFVYTHTHLTVGSWSGEHNPIHPVLELFVFLNLSQCQHLGFDLRETQQDCTGGRIRHSCPQELPRAREEQPSWGKQVSDESQVEDPAAPRCPEGLLNPEAPKENPCPGRGHMSHEMSRWNKSLAELWAHQHVSSYPIQTKQSQPLWFSFSHPSHSLLGWHSQGFTPAKDLAFSWLLVCQEHALPSRTLTKTIRRNDLHFSLH